MMMLKEYVLTHLHIVGFQERPPPVPPSRPYTVTGNTKLGYPQTRVMKMPFPGELAPATSL
jgi:dachs protein